MENNNYYYRNILADENLRGNKIGFIRSGKLFVAPEVFILLGDDDMRETVLSQLKIKDELHFGKVVAVFAPHPLTPSPKERGDCSEREEILDDGFMGYAVVTQYPMEGARGFAMVKFLDRKVMGNELVVGVERVRGRTPHP